MGEPINHESYGIQQFFQNLLSLLKRMGSKKNLYIRYTLDMHWFLGDYFLFWDGLFLRILVVMLVSGRVSKIVLPQMAIGWTPWNNDKLYLVECLPNGPLGFMPLLFWRTPHIFPVRNWGLCKGSQNLPNQPVRTSWNFLHQSFSVDLCRQHIRSFLLRRFTQQKREKKSLWKNWSVKVSSCHVVDPWCFREVPPPHHVPSTCSPCKREHSETKWFPDPWNHQLTEIDNSSL